MLKLDNPEEFINRRRRQMHVHSVIYYHLHTSIIDDATFDKWAVELANAQKEHPKHKHTGYMPGVFADWTGDTGMHLPVTDRVLSLAESLLAAANKRGEPTSPIVKRKPAEQRTEAWEGDVGYQVN